jgi:Cu2+-exporting ATPase
LAVETQSEHPLAEAMVNRLRSEDIGAAAITSVESIIGKGIKANFNNKKYYAGNNKLLEEQNVFVSDKLYAQATELEQGANTVIFFAEESKVIAVVALSDKIKLTSVEAIRMLKEQGIEIYMLTGDNAATARSVATIAGIEHFEAEVMPVDKAAFVKRLQTEGKIVAMVGDGINDSNALAQADVSIAMGKGSDIAIDVAKMTIISSDLKVIPKAIQLSRGTVRTIKQNLFWAFVYNLIGIPIAAGVLYPTFHFLLNPMIAGAAMALSSLSVVSNSLRLRSIKL